MHTDKTYERIAQLFWAVANAKRLKLLFTIKDREVTVGEISRLLDVRKSNTSQHLKTLKLMGFVKSRRQSKNVYYKVSSPTVIKLLQLFP